MKNMFTTEMVKKSAIFRRVVAVVSALAVVLGVTLNAVPAIAAAGITASAATPIYSVTLEASGEKNYNIPISGVDMSAVSIVDVTFKSTMSSMNGGGGYNDANGWVPASSFSCDVPEGQAENTTVWSLDVSTKKPTGDIQAQIHYMSGAGKIDITSVEFKAADGSVVKTLNSPYSIEVARKETGSTSVTPAAGIDYTKTAKIEVDIASSTAKGTNGTVGVNKDSVGGWKSAGRIDKADSTAAWEDTWVLTGLNGCDPASLQVQFWAIDVDQVLSVTAIRFYDADGNELTADSTPAPTLTFDPETANVNVGRTTTVTIIGKNTDGYEYTAKSYSDAIATATANGTVVTVTGVTIGLVKIKVTGKKSGADDITAEFTVNVPHDLEKHDAVSATCTTDGNEVYWTCSVKGCKKIFSNEDSTAEFDEIPTIPALGHNYVNGTCTRCGKAESDAGIKINETNFPDENFRKYVSDNCDTDKNGYLSSYEIESVRGIVVSEKSISDMTGIEYFTEMYSLDCTNNQLTSLDTSKNTKLQDVFCSNNNLTSLNVSQNTALIRLDCDKNKLTSLDVSQNTALTILYCHENQLTSLDVSKNAALLSLLCYNNQLTSLDVSQNTALRNLDCNDNQRVVQTCVFDPATLTNGFELSKASNWTNAKIENGKIISDGTGTATYTYDCGNNKTATFSIKFGEHNYVNGTCTVCGARDDNDKFEITVNPGEKTIAVGDDFTATVLVTGTTPDLENVDGSMQATYDDTIVSLDDGSDTDNGTVYTITGVSAGTTTVKFEWMPNASTGIELERPITVSCDVTVTDGTTPPAADTSEWKAAFNGFTGDWGGWQGSASEKGILTHTCTVKDVMDANGMTSIDELGGISAQVWNASVGDRVAYAIRIEAADGTIRDVRSGIYTVAEGNNGADGTLKQYQTAATGGDFVFAPTDVLKIAIAAGETIPTIPSDDEPTPPVTGSVIWEGNTDMGTAWTVNVQIAANKFADIKAGDTLKYTFTCEPDAQMKIASRAEGWPVIPGPNPDSEWGTINISDTSFSFVLTAADVTAIKEYGMAVSGKNYTLTKVELIPKADPKPPVVDPGHEHTPATAWSSDSTGHWHACSGCDEKLSFAAHTSDSGTVTTPATETTSGTRTYKCTVCEYVIRTVTIPPTGEHTHIFGTEWKYSDTRHWHECTVCGDKSDHAAHTEDSGTVTKAPTETETGVKTYKCKVCGYVLRTEVIPATGGGSGNTSRPDDTSEPDDIGNIYKDTQAGDNVPNAEIATPTNTLAEAALTPEERESVKNGEDIGIVLKLEDGTAIVSDKDKAAVEAALNGSENLKLAQYLEINLYKIVGGVETEITQTNEPITIKIAVPEALRGSGREFVLIRVHDGETVLLPDSDNDENTVTVETDRFSVYALAYRENVSADTPGENPNTGVAPTGTYLIVIGSVMLFIILFLTLFTGRNGMSEERKERVFASLIAWGKKGGKIRAAVALAAIFLLLSFYYGIGMKTAEK